jgi:hypothetical protein
MRLIDADALKSNLGLSNNCKTCKIGATKNCQLETFEVYGICTMLDDAPTVSGWVRVEDRLPDETEDVIICYEWTGFSGTKYREVTVNDLREVKQISDRIIAWMPLPEPPKEDDA